MHDNNPRVIKAETYCCSKKKRGRNILERHCIGVGKRNYFLPSAAKGGREKVVYMVFFE